MLSELVREGVSTTQPSPLGLRAAEQPAPRPSEHAAPSRESEPPAPARESEPPAPPPSSGSPNGVRTAVLMVTSGSLCQDGLVLDGTDSVKLRYFLAVEAIASRYALARAVACKTPLGLRCPRPRRSRWRPEHHAAPGHQSRRLHHEAAENRHLCCGVFEGGDHLRSRVAVPSLISTVA